MTDKKSEVEVRILNATKSFVVKVTVPYGAMNMTQSLKSKSKRDKVLDAKKDRICREYREMVEPELRLAFPGIILSYTEANSLLEFENADGEWEKEWTVLIPDSMDEEIMRRAHDAYSSDPLERALGKRQEALLEEAIAEEKRADDALRAAVSADELRDQLSAAMSRRKELEDKINAAYN